MDPACLLMGLMALFAAATAQKQDVVSVMFESHCPDSRNFIHNDLVPFYHKIEQLCDLKLIPFGKAKSKPGGGFSCQHGPKECRGNMILSCAFNRLSPGRPQVKFVSCFMADPDNGGKQCCEESGISWADVEYCLTSGEGTELQKKAEELSTPIQISHFVPTIIHNGVYEQSYQNDAVNGRFKSKMCERLSISNCD